MISLCSAYEIRFEGINDSEALKLIESVSQLQKLKDNPPATLTGLKRRAENDTAAIVQALHSLAYYQAKVDFTVTPDGTLVIVKIEPGPVYPLAAFNIRYFQNGEEIEHFSACSLTLEDLKVKLGEPALPDTILAAEDNLLDKLNLHGYAFASIKKRDVFADQQANTVIVWIEVETGPLTYFGPVKINGLERVHEGFFFKKLRWHEGDLYDPHKLEKTQEALELSGLFRSVNITHAEHPTDGNKLPLEINVLEGKQRSLGFGLNYTTELGPGVTAEWEDRNVFGEGQKLSARADIWMKLQEGKISYLIPDFKSQNQNLIWQLDYNHERTKAFTETALSLSATIERKLTENLRFSYGAMYKLLRSQRSDRNGTFDLFKTPLALKWSNVDSILDPTKGATLQLKVIPSLQVFYPQFAYSINTLTTTFYQSLSKDDRHIFAAKLMLGSIIGAAKHDIPPPERFYAGSENALRGYKYLTVSPIGEDHKPLGGRSLFIYSLELRNRIGKNFGVVAFYEIGNVYLNYYPDFRKPLLQSAGIGLRYHTPVGPLRFDIAVPLNRRKHIDNAVEAYFSIGQAF
ncbi:autotransporter assembly complex protein TamA [Candidatus Protochlamydia phocaeensis]|uniref:autotransporter assembly complex protein TamA n=1 Tax=Candidatus Protochlamydia phocaeensis TaxID=1414722 RepID=UPI000839344A|nr:autotransporter assembly complex family protein [Candidatus Protochlamydia phocaeensis]